MLACKFYGNNLGARVGVVERLRASVQVRARVCMRKRMKVWA